MCDYYNKLESLRANCEIFCTDIILLLFLNIHKLLAGTLYLSESIIPILNSYVKYQNHLIVEEKKVNYCKNYTFVSNVQFQVLYFVLGNNLTVYMSMITMKK